MRRRFVRLCNRHHHQHNEKIKPYVQNGLGRDGGRGLWRQFEEQHIFIYGPLNEVAGTIFFTNSEYLFLYIDVCVYILKKWHIYINLQITYTSPVEEIHSTLCFDKLLYM